MAVVIIVDIVGVFSPCTHGHAKNFNMYYMMRFFLLLFIECFDPLRLIGFLTLHFSLLNFSFSPLFFLTSVFSFVLLCKLGQFLVLLTGNKGEKKELALRQHSRHFKMKWKAEVREKWHS